MNEQNPNIVPMDDQPAKPQYIAQQTNNNCQQFFGPVTGCVFAMPGATVAPPVVNAPQEQKPQSAKPNKPTTTRKRTPKTITPPKDDKEHGVERATFGCSKYVTPNHLKLFLQELQQVGWVSSRTNEVDFRALFSGKLSSCEIIWTGEMGLGTLKELFQTLLEEQLISLPGGARSVNSVLEDHFVDANGQFIKDIHKGTPADSAFQTIYKLVDILKVRLKTDNIKKDFEVLETWDPSYH